MGAMSVSDVTVARAETGEVGVDLAGGAAFWDIIAGLLNRTPSLHETQSSECSCGGRR